MLPARKIRLGSVAGAFISRISLPSFQLLESVTRGQRLAKIERVLTRIRVGAHAHYGLAPHRIEDLLIIERLGRKITDASVTMRSIVPKYHTPNTPKHPTGRDCGRFHCSSQSANGLTAILTSR